MLEGFLFFIHYCLRSWRARDLPLETLEKVRRYAEWMEFDIIEREAMKAAMSREELDELREATEAHAEWSDALPKSVEALKRLIARRRAAEQEA